MALQLDEAAAQQICNFHKKLTAKSPSGYDEKTQKQLISVVGCVFSSGFQVRDSQRALHERSGLNTSRAKHSLVSVTLLRTSASEAQK